MIKLTKKQAIEYKQRWQETALIQTEELQTTPMSLKFRQLCFLMDSFHFPRKDQNREKEIAAVRRRWLNLKKYSK